MKASWECLPEKGSINIEKCSIVTYVWYPARCFRKVILISGIDGKPAAHLRRGLLWYIIQKNGGIQRRMEQWKTKCVPRI